MKEKNLYIKSLKDLHHTMELTSQNNQLLEKASMLNQDKTESKEKLIESRGVRERLKGENGLLYALRLINYV